VSCCWIDAISEAVPTLRIDDVGLIVHSKQDASFGKWLRMERGYHVPKVIAFFPFDIWGVIAYIRQRGILESSKYSK
jgi:hypothetical protein